MKTGGRTVVVSGAQEQGDMHVRVMTHQTLQHGDKLCDRYGNKGIACVQPATSMPWGIGIHTGEELHFAIPKKKPIKELPTHE